MIQDQRITAVLIFTNTKLIDALKRMDESGHKLLIVMDDDLFFGVISIGDLQRCILNCVDLNSFVKDYMRNDIIFAYDSTSEEKIRTQMIKFRMEFMPIIDNSRHLINVIFWEDLFSSEMESIALTESCPVVIMAGGLGTRLRPLTNIIPKPLIPINEKTIIEYIIDRFKKVGCNDFYCSINYKAEMIKYYLSSVGIEISYFQEPYPLGTAGSLYLLRDKLTTTFFVINCDILLDIELSDLLAFHRSNNNMITLVSVVKNFQLPYGVLKTKDNGELFELQEKPETIYQINSGLYVVEPAVFDFIEDNTFLHITTLIEKLIKTGNRVGVFPVNEHSWVDMGNWDEYLKLIQVR